MHDGDRSQQLLCYMRQVNRYSAAPAIKMARAPDIMAIEFRSRSVEGAWFKEKSDLACAADKCGCARPGGGKYMDFI